MLGQKVGYDTEPYANNGSTLIINVIRSPPAGVLAGVIVLCFVNPAMVTCLLPNQ